jgi:hypothetical protein
VTVVPRHVAFGVFLTLLFALGHVSSSAGGHTGRAQGVVYFRPVLCFVPAYDAAARVPVTLTPSSCSASSRLDGSNLRVAPGESSNRYTSHTVPPDGALAGVPSTTPGRETASAIVLLPADSRPADSTAQRYLLGPAEMTSAAIARASATRNQAGAWVVDYTTTTRGTVLWDRVAEENFHALLGIDLNGVVVSAPIIQPTQTSFTSFDGRGEISGGLDRAEAMDLARALQSPQG